MDDIKLPWGLVTSRLRYVYTLVSSNALQSSGGFTIFGDTEYVLWSITHSHITIAWIKFDDHGLGCGAFEKKGQIYFVFQRRNLMNIYVYW